MTLDRIAWFIGEVARPVGILIAIGCAGASSVILALKLSEHMDGSLLAGAIWLGATGIFVGKAVEEFRKNRNAADVQIARAGGDRRKPQPVTIENDPDDPVPVEEAKGA